MSGERTMGGSNEAADELRVWLDDSGHDVAAQTQLLDEALAEERKIVCDTIRRRLSRFYELMPDGAGLRGFIEGTLDTIEQRATERATEPTEG